MEQVVDLAASDTHELRRRVLRDGTSSDKVVWEGDELDSTFHLGLRIDDELVAISSWMAVAYPDRPAVPGFQLRGMATAPERRGRGLGARLLAAGVERCRERGAGLIWARARDTALTFYEAHGFVAVGPGYIDLTTGLPHHDVIRELSGPLP